MTEQDRLRILYDLTIRDIDHANRPVVHAVRYFVPIPFLVIVLASMVTAFDLTAPQASALLLATMPAAVFAYVGWNNTHDDRVEALTLKATELRLQITDDDPIAADRSNAARDIERNIADAKRRTAPAAGSLTGQ